MRDICSAAQKEFSLLRRVIVVPILNNRLSISSRIGIYAGKGAFDGVKILWPHWVLAPMWRNPTHFVEQFWDVRLVVRHAKSLGDKIGNEVISPVSVLETMGGWPLFE